jgi:hypothetical protein
LTYRVCQKYLTIWQHSCEWNRWRGEFVLERPSSETQSTSLAMERGSVKHGAFAVETNLKNNDSVVVTQRTFCWHFNIHRNDSVPSRGALLLWARNLRETESAAKRNVQEESLHLELLRTSNDCVRLLPEVLRLRECAHNKGRHLTDTIFGKRML